MTTNSDLNLDWLISVDDHVIEPAGVWQDRVPAKYKDAAERTVKVFANVLKANPQAAPLTADALARLIEAEGR